MSDGCQHTRLRSTVVFLEPNHKQTAHVAVIRVHCHECGCSFEIVDAAISPDRSQARLTLIEEIPGLIQ